MTTFLHSFIDTHLLDAIKTYHPHLYSVSIAEKKSDLSLFMATIVEKEIIGSKEKTYQWYYA